MAMIAREPLNESWLRKNLTYEKLASEKRAREKRANEKLAGSQAGFARLELRQQSESTNAELAQALRHDWDSWPDLSILTTQHQTAGKGRLDRVWDSPAQSTIAVSVVLKPRNRSGRPLPTQSYGWFTLIAALALVETLKTRAGITSEIKWPNDVQVGGKKISGILAQLVADSSGNPPAVVLGTGINVSQTANELPMENATSIVLAANPARSIDEVGGVASVNASAGDVPEGATSAPLQLPTRDEFLVHYLTNFARHYKDFTAVDGNPQAGSLSILTLISSLMNTLGATVDVTLPSGEIRTGRATSLDATGALIILDNAGNPHTINAGEVQRVRRAPDAPQTGRTPLTNQATHPTTGRPW